jgi:hypothetical protein
MNIEMILTLGPLYNSSSSSSIYDTVIINVDKDLRRPSSKRRISRILTTLTFNLTKVEDIQLCNNDEQKRAVRHFRVRNISPKFKSISFSHKDKINTNVFETVLERYSVIFFISILRCVICLVRRSLRIKSSTIKKNKDKYSLIDYFLKKIGQNKILYLLNIEKVFLLEN